MHSNNIQSGSHGARPGFAFSRTLSVFSNFNTPGLSGVHSGRAMTAEEQRALTLVARALPLHPLDIKDFPRQVARRKKNKQELKAEFLVSLGWGE